ncbi:MAG: Smr/MutS family protein [Spirochaetes bacterium]|nr:Smr/MutS family protein [Spirochaetota bacterium]
MDFGKILENWEKRNQSSSYPDKDKTSNAAGEDIPKSSRNLKILKKMKPQATLDLHGLTSAEAEIELNKFLAFSKSKGYTKVCIIHGKGIHSNGEAVLVKVVDNVLKNCPFAGTTGFSQQKDGGKGSRWIILK